MLGVPPTSRATSSAAQRSTYNLSRSSSRSARATMTSDSSPRHGSRRSIPGVSPPLRYSIPASSKAFVSDVRRDASVDAARARVGVTEELLDHRERDRPDGHCGPVVVAEPVRHLPRRRCHPGRAAQSSQDVVDVLAGHRLPGHPHEQRLTRAGLHAFGEMPVDDRQSTGWEGDVAFRAVLGVPKAKDRMFVAAAVDDAFPDERYTARACRQLSAVRSAKRTPARSPSSERSWVSSTGRPRPARIALPHRHKSRRRANVEFGLVDRDANSFAVNQSSANSTRDTCDPPVDRRRSPTAAIAEV